MPTVVDRVRTSMPTAALLATSRSTRSGSKRPNGRSPRSRIVTAEPARAAMWANSKETNPPPTNTMRGGSDSRCRNSVLSIINSAPGNPRDLGRAPVATSTLCTSWRVPATSIVDGEVNVAAPWRVSTPFEASSRSALPGAGSVKPRVWHMRSAQLIDSPCGSMPLSRIRLAASTTSAPRRKIFFGSQPRSAHVPPYGNSSTIAVLQPAAAALFAAEIPAMPAPMMNRS